MADNNIVGGGRRNQFSVFSLLAIGFMTVMLTNSVGNVNAKIPLVPDYFPEVRDDLSLVKWAHAVNSREKLQEALNDSTMMIESDILMGTVHGSVEIVPIMAHQPATTSDLSAVNFIDRILHANLVDKKRKGIKLDFKQYEALRPVLQHLKNREDDINFPIWLNADILQGPVNSTSIPIPGKQFIDECVYYFNDITLSLGWTTTFGYVSGEVISEGEYTMAQITEMLDTLEDVDSPITFPVRAGIAAQSIDTLNKLLSLRGDLHTTLTLWSPANDPVNLDELRRLISSIGKSKTYVDLPFDVETGPKNNQINPKHDGLQHDEQVHDTINRSGSIKAFFLQTFCIILTVLMINC